MVYVFRENAEQKWYHHPDDLKLLGQCNASANEMFNKTPM